MKDAFVSTLCQGAAQLGLILTEPQLRRFERYRDALLLWNRRINLVSLQDPGDLARKHLLDCLTPLPHLPRNLQKILDIGSGAGLPGIPLKIVLERPFVALLEASRRKTSFLKEVLGLIALTDAAVLHHRAEDLALSPAHRGAYDAVVSRAAFPLPGLIRRAGVFLAEGGLLVAMKGTAIAAELAEAETVAPAEDLSSPEIHTVTHPGTGESRKLVIYRKIK